MRATIRRFRYLSAVLLSFLLISVFLYDTYSNPGGYTQRTSATSSGCGGCHGSSPSAQVSANVVSGSGSFTVITNSTTSFTVTVSTTNLSMVNAGVNFAVKTDQTSDPGTSTGTLVAGTGLRIANSELTHNTPKTLSGGSASWTFQWTAPSTPGTYYLRVLAFIGNGNGNNDAGDTWNWMTVQPITVTASGTVTLTSPNGGEELCSGKNQLIRWNSSGISQVRLELSSNGGSTWPTVLVDNLNATPNSWSWAIPDNQPAGSNYMVRVLDAMNYATNDASNSSFVIHSKTAISSHPSNLFLCTGNTAVFQVTATGDNLQYYWKKNGVFLQNQNMTSLYLYDITKDDEGDYSCVVIGLCDSVSSTVATLSIKESVTIVTQPQDDTVCVGSSVKLSVEATGTSLMYSWSKNGKTLPNTNTSELSISNVSRLDSGLYECVVSGACEPKVTTRTTLLHVLSPVSIISQPLSKTVTEGDSAVIEVKAGGTDLSYQWRKNSSPLSGQISSKLVIYNINLADSGSYDCIIKNRCGQLITKQVVITVIKPEEADISLNLTNVDFGTVGLGSSKDTVLSGVIKNISKAVLEVYSIQINGKDAGDFNIFGITTPISIQPNESASFNAEFFPASLGAKTATISFSTNAKSVVSISLIGYCQSIEESLIVNNWDFGTVLIGNNARSINTVKNIGSADVKVFLPVVVSYDSLNFQLLDEEKYPFILKPDSSAEINFLFVPTIAKTYDVNVFVNNSGADVVFILSGRGTLSDIQELATVPEIFPNPVNDCLTINNFEGSYKIIDLIGTTVSTGIVSKGQKINIGSLAQGVYLISYGSKAGRIIKL